MEIKEGMYVRTNSYGILKIEKFEGYSDTVDEIPYYSVDMGGYIPENEILKASFNIIKVLEKGDYADGNEILDITLPDVCGDEELDDGLIHFANYNEYPQNIKEVVTHEYFEQGKYIVGE